MEIVRRSSVWPLMRMRHLNFGNWAWDRRASTGWPLQLRPLHYIYPTFNLAWFASHKCSFFAQQQFFSILLASRQNFSNFSLFFHAMFLVSHQLRRLTQQACAWNQWTNTAGKNKEFQLQQEWIWSPPGERYRTKKKLNRKNGRNTKM